MNATYSHLFHSSTPPPDNDYHCNNDLQKDLLRRLRTVLQKFRDEEDLEPDEYPGMDGLARELADEQYLKHKDKEVRLYTVLACVEVFYVVSVICVCVYAP